MTQQLNVRIVTLPPMRVASFYGYGAGPEMIAHGKLEEWARPRGLLQPNSGRLVFGFNNPSPTPGSPNYGYEVWIVVHPDTAPDGEARMLDFPGGLYAVTRCVVPEGDFAVIGNTWQQLNVWREDSPYKAGCHQWLEESLPLDLPGVAFVLDLYLPLAE